MQVAGYQITELLHSGSRSRIYRGSADDTGARVVIKIQHQSDLRSAEARARFEHEYQLARKASGPGCVAAIDYRQQSDLQAIVFEDRGAGVSLRQYLEARIDPPDPGEFLRLSLLMVSALEQVHAHNIIHRDINPANFIYFEEQDDLRIIDFGLSSEGGGELAEASAARAIEGTLAYISPEQTGRTNRVLDYRSDFYSLGASFYYMLSGRPPFESDDPMQLIHAHIAMVPEALHTIAAGVPPALAAIVAKLLAKNPGERYQSTAGLRADLEYCLREWRARAAIPDFAPGAADVSSRFELSGNLFGREREIQNLLEAFERVRQGKVELLLITGYSGIGKSSLVSEIHKPILRSRGSFIRGKFDQHRRDVPYSAIIQAFTDLVRLLLAEDEALVADWRRRIQKAVGSNGQVITGMIPEVERIIGEQPELVELGPIEAQNRFRMVFQNFVAAFADAAHPLVLFLDDLQWIDPASLELLVVILQNPDTGHLLLIGSYRDNEVGADHPLSYALDEIQSGGCPVRTVELRPLNVPALELWIAACLRRSPGEVPELAELVYQRTGGNPFFAGEFLKQAHHDGLLLYSDGGWRWDLEGMQALCSADNVAQLMVSRINSLPDISRDCLKAAAAIGSYFDLSDLATILDIPAKTLDVAIEPIVAAGLTTKIRGRFHFAHDHIRETAYALLDEQERARLHLRIARRTYARTTPAELNERIFYITNQFNRATSLMQNETGRALLVELNKRAGQRARKTAAYQPAFGFFQQALDALAPSAWESDYAATLELHCGAAESAFLAHDLDAMERLVALTESRLRSPVDAVNLYITRMSALTTQNRQAAAIDYAFDRLKLLRYPVPRRPGRIAILRELLLLRFALRRKSQADLEALPMATDPRIIAIARIMSYCDAAAYITNLNTFAFLILRLMRIFLRYGYVQETPSILVGYAVMLCGQFGQMQAGLRMSLLATTLANRMFETARVRVDMVHYFMVQPWIRHARESVAPLRKAYEMAVNVGNLEFAGYSLASSFKLLHFIGRNLDELSVELQAGLESLRKLKQQTATTLAEILLQSVLCLRDGECRSSSLAGPIFDENTRLAGFREGEMDAVLGDYYSVRVQLAYLLGEFDVARELLREGQPYAHTLTAQLQSTNRVLFRALTNIEVARSHRQSLPATVAADLKRMERWSENAPANFAHTTALLRAEIGRFHGNLETAVTHYAQALSLARQNGFPADEALILERCGRFWQSRGHAELARVYLEKARDAWRARGALALVRRLEREFPDLVSRESGGLDEGLSGAALSDSSESGSSGHGQIDLGSVLKISRALSSEMDLERLHKRVLEIVLENAGADRGVYVSCEHGRFIVEVEAQLGSQEATATGGLPLDQYPRVARSVVLYAARMGETVLLNNLAENERFAGDEYLQVEQPGSILALPVMNRSELKGIVYLENHVNREAFTPGLSRVLDVIAGQFAVSLENARLYADLEGRVRERTEQLRATLDQVQALKVRQDGDYYLTAQLMKPFGRIQVDPGRTKVDSLVHQKKKFKFKKWTEEIGGDLCAAQSIRLQGRDCVVFLNGDAMGKSIQGAGGAMVLGSVFQTLLQRSSRSAEVQAMAPGAWLRDAIRELQDVFIGFEGGMFISLVLGIVDNEQGHLYFVTAEHPYTVLYRDQHARFLDTEHRMHKIGNPMTDENAPVFSFPLKPGDVVICGSDGRDDIRLPTGEIAENYEDFLRRVEEGRGNLHEIYSALERQGELIDDLSLLRIEYRHA